MTTIIKPTVGRVLHFFPTAQYMAGRKLAFGDPSQPLAAVVAYVHNDTMVNLTVWDQNGLQFDVCSVQLVQEGDTVPLGSFYAAWMDYQKGQAAKADELQIKVDVLAGPARPFGQSDSALEQATYVRDRAAIDVMAGQAAATLATAIRASHGVTDNAIEQEIQAKGLTAPRVTMADIAANIASEHYFTAEHGVIGAAGVAKGGRCKEEGMAIVEYSPAKTAHLGLLTFCVLVLRSGFTVTGESACASPENFDADIGRKIARENAVEKIWPLMGYALKQRLHKRALWDAEPKTSDGVSGD